MVHTDCPNACLPQISSIWKPLSFAATNECSASVDEINSRKSGIHGKNSSIVAAIKDNKGPIGCTGLNRRKEQGAVASNAIF
jgi:hypothetical protein